MFSVISYKILYKISCHIFGDAWDDWMDLTFFLQKYLLFKNIHINFLFLLILREIKVYQS